MRAIIIEDEQLAVRELVTALGAVAPEVEVVATAATVSDAVEVLTTVEHDMIFMDIHIGDGSSFEIFDEVAVSVPVIFTTAYDNYTMEAFRNQGIDYLLKPFDTSDLKRALAKLTLLSAVPTTTCAESVAKESEPEPKRKERFLVTYGNKLKSIEVTDIAYFWAEGKYMNIATHDGGRYVAGGNLSSVEPRLSAKEFFRVNRSYIISYRSIRDMVRYSNNRIKVSVEPQIEGQEIFVSADRVQDFRDWLNH